MGRAVRFRTGTWNDRKSVDPPIVDFSQSFWLAVRMGDSALLAALSEGLALVMADGTFRRLL